MRWKFSDRPNSEGGRSKCCFRLHLKTLVSRSLFSLRSKFLQIRRKAGAPSRMILSALSELKKLNSIFFLVLLQNQKTLVTQPLWTLNQNFFHCQDRPTEIHIVVKEPASNSRKAFLSFCFFLMTELKTLIAVR